MDNERAQRYADLDITREELDRIGQAMKDKEFMNLLNEYCKEVTDPDNIKLYQDEMTQLERERGVDVTFINPEAGYVIKTSVNGCRKAYINVCYNENVGKPSSEPHRLANGEPGRHWELPHMLAPPRDDFTKNDTKTTFCTVYDVIFHPYTMHLAARFPEFRKMVTDTALDSVEKQFNLKLDKKNIKFPKMKFKGTVGRASVVRKAIDNFEKKEDDFLDQMNPHPFYNQKQQPEKVKKVNHQQENIPDKSPYTTPKYSIKQRSDVDFQDYRNDKTCHMNAAIPTMLTVEIELPLLNSTAETQLDVTEKSLIFISEKPAKYKLQIQLPYVVNETNGNAKFDKSTRKLIVTLPVIRKPTPLLLVKEDSGVESDHESPVNELISEVSYTENNSAERTNDANSNNESTPPQFLDPNLDYLLPEYTHNMYKNIVAFTLHVKNVDPQSVEKRLTTNSLHLKFNSISSGFYSTYFAFYLRLPETHRIKDDEVQIETWDNNVIVQLPLENCDIPLKSFQVGSNESDSKEENLLSPSITTPIEPSNNSTFEVRAEYLEIEDEVVIEVKPKKSEAIPVREETNEKLQKSYSYSESSGDELSCSQSPSKNKGILKHRRSRTLNRSVSESSVDDLQWPNSFDTCTKDSDDCIPEEQDAGNASSFKKTVRFNDHVSKQIFRMNSSILGQKKKNQRKNRNKKRSNERRHSESELSENEDKKDQFRKKEVVVKRDFYSESELSETECKDYFKKSALKKNDQANNQKKLRGRLDSGVGCDSPTEKDQPKLTTATTEFQSDLIFDLDI